MFNGTNNWRSGFLTLDEFLSSLEANRWARSHLNEGGGQKEWGEDGTSAQNILSCLLCGIPVAEKVKQHMGFP